MSRQEPLVFIVSGEASGDNLAGPLMGAIKAQTGGRVRFAGVGGPQSEAQGLESLFPMGELSIMGLAEVLPHLPRLIKRLKQTAALARELKPDVIVTIDSPGFCMRPSSITWRLSFGPGALAASASSPSAWIT